MNIPTLKYLDQFWSWLHCGRLPSSIMDLYPNMKEISESMAACFKMKPYLDKISTLLVVGDGIKPRTGALFALLHPHLTVHSIDPAMIDINTYTNTCNNLHVYAYTIENFIIKYRHMLTSITQGMGVVCVHCHADFDNYMPELFSFLPNNIFKAIYALKCCRIYQSFTSKQLQDYKLQLIEEDLDFNVYSPDRKYTIWQSI